MFDLAKSWKQIHRACSRPQTKLRHIHLQDEILHVRSVLEKPGCCQWTDAVVDVWREDGMEGAGGEPCE